MRLVLVATSLTLLLAGCLEPVSDTLPDDDTRLPTFEELGALVYNEDHDHTDRTVHAAVARGLEVKTVSTLSEDGKSLGEYTEADHEQGLIAVAIVTGPGSSMRIVLLDEAALPDAKIVGYFDEPNSYGDVKLDTTDPLVYVPFSSGTLGFSIWDISTVSAPKRVGEAPGAGCHMLHTMAISGMTYVFCAGVGGSQIYRIEETPEGLRGVPIAMATPQSDPEVMRYNEYYDSLDPLIGPALVTTPHDQTAQPDPITGQPLLVTAHELQGIRVFDVSIPAAPREISAWRGEGMREPLDRVHTVGIAEIDGKRIGFGATETFSNVQPVLYIVDFTDWSAPKFLARWSPPNVQGDQGIVYSMHNLQVVGTRLYATNFHAGLWIINVSDPSAPVTEGLRTPVVDTEYPRPGESSQIGPFTIFNNMNQYWDVIVVNGYTIVTDMSAGIEVLHVDGDPAGDPDWDGFT